MLGVLRDVKGGADHPALIEEEIALMRRIIMLLTVAVLLAASMSFSGLAWAQGQPEAPGAQGAQGLAKASQHTADTPGDELIMELEEQFCPDVGCDPTPDPSE